jgi:undecaprenyl diphosphate synthase
MDGNGRWARARGQPRLAGHKAGTQNIRRVLEGCVEHGVEVLTVYAFSTENWGRPGPEVRGIMRLLEQNLDEQLPELHAEGVQIRHSGSLERVSPPLVEKIQEALELTKDNQRIILNVAFNYGGRAEIVDAVRQLIGEGVAADAVDQELFGRYLYTAGLPDPDLIVRTAGEMRLSNFLIWQGAYAEYYSTSKYWPDFDREELRKALEAYAGRKRRFGRLENT